MQRLTDSAWQKVCELSQRYAVSTDAVQSMLEAVANGNGTMAQFYHSELGGGGQWMQGGMTMVGDMFNHGLKSKVDGLCNELSQLYYQQPFVPLPPRQSQQQGGGASLYVSGSSGGYSNWWPAELGSPNGSGGQNNIRYAYFNGARRLAVELNGNVTVYDTLDNNIGGVSQQQGSGGSLTLSSQYGTIDVATLPIISINGVAPQSAPQQSNHMNYSTSNAAPAPQANYSSGNSSNYSTGNSAGNQSVQEADIFAKIERLADLQQKGILSVDEFAAKKAELLSRL